MSKLSPILKIFAFLPPILLLVGTIGTMSCGKGLFPTVTATNTSSATATATTGAFAFATNFNDGKISEFTRNTTTGKLTLVGTVAAGSSLGPKGLASLGSFLYAANFKDNTVLQYTIGSGAILTPIGTGSVSDGSGSGPEQVVINPAGTFLWASNFSNGTISGWAITSGTGALTTNGTVSGLSGPFGMAVNSAGSILYVADNKAGLIYTFTINSSGGLAQVAGSPVPSLGVSNGSPGLMVIDPTGLYLYVDDLTNGVVSMFTIDTTGLPVFGSIQPTTFTSNVPVGIGIAAISSGTFVLTANQSAGNLWYFQELNSGILSSPIAYGTLSSPTGLTVDPQNAFVYTANQGSSSVGIFQLNVACPTTVQVLCQIGSVATEKSPPSGGSGPFAVILGN
ncbi:MAG: lactonase family protein [Candidatus Binataceae bacterium]